MAKLRRFIENVIDFLNGIGTRRIWTFAAASTFYLFLAIIPIVTLTCSLLPYTPLTQETLLRIMDDVLPNSFYQIVSGVVEDVYAGSAATLSIAAVASVWTASLSVLSLMRGLDSVYHVKRKTNFIVFRLTAYFFMVIMLASILVTLCAIVYGQNILDLIRSRLTESWAVNILFAQLKYGRYIVITVFLFVVFEIFYKWMPAGRRKLAKQWRGALFTTISWMVFSAVFSFYVSFSDRYGIYGLLGTIIVAMLWVYYCMFFLLLGGYINNYLYEHPLKKKAKAYETEEESPEAEFIEPFLEDVERVQDYSPKTKPEPEQDSTPLQEPTPEQIPEQKIEPDRIPNSDSIEETKDDRGE
jgi:membrane protein